MSPLAGLAVAVALGGWPGVVAGLVATVVLWHWLPRLPTGADRALARRAAADLPLALDLIALALRTGLPPDQAAIAVGSATGGPVGDRLVRVGRALELGDSADGAWSYVADLPGTGRLVRAAVHSSGSGRALADTLTRLAGDLREARLRTAEAAASRVTLLAVVPLGLCFLPAFLLAGVVPLGVAVLTDVL